MLTPWTVTVTGDLQAELTSSLKDYKFIQIATDFLIYNDIDVSAGGTAANFAFEAVLHFKAVNLLGHLGNDLFGSFVRDTLVQHGIHVCCEHSPNTKTAVAIYLRDVSNVATDGVRLLLVDRGANRLHDVRQVERYRPTICQSDLFYADGYCLLEEPRRSATLYAMTLAHTSNVVVAFDLVPHDAYRYFSLDDFKQWIQLIDVLIVEVRGIRAMLGLAWEEEILDPQKAYDTWSVFEEKFPGKDVYLQFGAGNIDESLLCRSGHVPEWRANGYVGDSKPRGFGDRLAAANLAAYLTLRRAK
jgi:sugar/nucleoside kinase (ribokinase family)